MLMKMSLMPSLFQKSYYMTLHPKALRSRGMEHFELKWVKRTKCNKI